MKKTFIIFILSLLFISCGNRNSFDFTIYSNEDYYCFFYENDTSSFSIGRPPYEETYKYDGDTRTLQLLRYIDKDTLITFSYNNMCTFESFEVNEGYKMIIYIEDTLGKKYKMCEFVCDKDPLTNSNVSTKKRIEYYYDNNVTKNFYNDRMEINVKVMHTGETIETCNVLPYMPNKKDYETVYNADSTQMFVDGEWHDVIAVGY